MLIVAFEFTGVAHGYMKSFLYGPRDIGPLDAGEVGQH